MKNRMNLNKAQHTVREIGNIKDCSTSILDNELDNKRNQIDIEKPYSNYSKNAKFVSFCKKRTQQTW